VFGRRTDDRVAAERAAAEERIDPETAERTADDRAVTEDRTEDRVAEDRVAEDRVAEERVAEERVAERDREVAEDERRRIPTGRATVTEVPEDRTVPATAAGPTVVSPRYSGRTSGMATIGLILGVTAMYAALSGRLAPVGLAAAVLGLLFSGAGLSAGSRRGVNGRGVATLALLLSVVGGVFAVLAMNHTVSWLNSDVDQVARLREWLDAQMPWLKSW
jgi:hypothetical protein